MSSFRNCSTDSFRKSSRDSFRKLFGVFVLKIYGCFPRNSSRGFSRKFHQEFLQKTFRGLSQKFLPGLLSIFFSDSCRKTKVYNSFNFLRITDIFENLPQIASKNTLHFLSEILTGIDSTKTRRGYFGNYFRYFSINFTKGNIL